MKNGKQATRKSKAGTSPCVQNCSKPRNRRYGKLDIVEGGTEYFSDDNKENIKPGEHSASSPQTRPSKTNTKLAVQKELLLALRFGQT